MSLLYILEQDWFLNTIFRYVKQSNWISLYSCNKKLRIMVSDPKITKVKILIHYWIFSSTPILRGKTLVEKQAIVKKAFPSSEFRGYEPLVLPEKFTHINFGNFVNPPIELNLN